jgi:hypothetical protein
VISIRTCSISLTVLKASPYLLVKDDSVVAKIVSVNAYGESDQSSQGSGAVIQLVADAPISLTNDHSTTTATVIRFTWNDGSSDGGTSVIDYTIFYDQGTGTFVQLEAGVTTQYYLTSVTLSAGTTYVFKVQTRNSVGLSSDSTELSILAAKLPDSPVSLIDVPGTTNANQIGLSWSDGLYNGGSPVIDY